MGFRNYLRDSCPEGVFGDIEDDEEIDDEEISKIKWMFTPNGYCEKCNSIIYNDNGACPDCHEPTKVKYHWYKKGDL